ncbi:MAG: fructose-bisphosphatase class II, partial [Microbacteriaceae bacterium]
GVLKPGSDIEIANALAAGLKLDHVYEANELVASDNTFFVATGVTDGELLRGVHKVGNYVTTESIVLRSKTGTVRRIQAEHLLEKWY